MWLPESDRKQCKTGESERVPVRRGGFIEREQGIKCEHRKAKPHQKKPARLLLRTLPQCDYRDGEAEKNSRQGPVPGKFRALLHHTPKRKHGRDPEKERKRVDRHEEGAKVENRGRV